MALKWLLKWCLIFGFWWIYSKRIKRVEEEKNNKRAKKELKNSIEKYQKTSL